MTQREAREEAAEKGMYDICTTHHLDMPDHNIKDAYRLGFDDGVAWFKANSASNRT